MRTDKSQVFSRPAMESIFLYIAREAVEAAEAAEPDAKTSVGAQVNMQNKAITGILMSVLSLEAFINVQAKDRLSSALWNSVEWLGLDDKWLVVTKLTTGKEWEKGKQPFQDFAALVRLRNALTHYKPKYVKGSDMFGNDFTGVMARRCFNTACAMMASFFRAKGQV